MYLVSDISGQMFITTLRVRSSRWKRVNNSVSMITDVLLYDAEHFIIITLNLNIIFLEKFNLDVVYGNGTAPEICGRTLAGLVVV